jgi:hypothetical protein
LAREKKRIEELKSEIASSPEICNYTDKQRKKLLGGEWRIGNGWADLGVSAGFHNKYFNNVYGYLCGYSHSSYLSALQVGQAQSTNDQQMLTQAILGIGIVLMAHFAFSYSAAFSSASTVLHAYPSELRIAEKWRFGHENMAKIYMTTNRPIETDLRKQATPACSAAYGRRCGMLRSVAKELSCLCPSKISLLKP